MRKFFVILFLLLGTYLIFKHILYNISYNKAGSNIVRNYNKSEADIDSIQKWLNNKKSLVNNNDSYEISRNNGTYFNNLKEIKYNGYNCHSEKNYNIFSLSGILSNSYDCNRMGSKYIKLLMVINQQKIYYINLGNSYTNGKVNFEGIRGTYDSGDDKYFIYNVSDYGGDDYGPYGMNKGLILDKDFNILKKIKIPLGPRRIKKGIFGPISCFSCGCSCYQHAEVFVFNGKIYVHVWGDAINLDDVGVYLLNQKENRWEQILKS